MKFKWLPINIFSFKTILLSRKKILCYTKLNSNEVYKIQIIIKYEKPI